MRKGLGFRVQGLRFRVQGLGWKDLRFVLSGSQYCLLVSHFMLLSYRLLQLQTMVKGSLARL